MERPFSFKTRAIFSRRKQGCQMAWFQAKNPTLGKFWRALDWKMFTYCMAIWNILRIFGMFYDHLVHFVFLWHSFSGFGIMHQEKSGNPGRGKSVFGADSSEASRNATSMSYDGKNRVCAIID
jgi:hypothetical protein